ncbi:MAG: hypothetical protein ACXACT_18280 [Candidatus Thorarchaeota archaeon]
MTEAGGGKVICEVNNRNRDTIDMAVAAGDLFYLNVDKAETDLQAAIMAAYNAQAGAIEAEIVADVPVFDKGLASVG